VTYKKISRDSQLAHGKFEKCRKKLEKEKKKRKMNNKN
jgi:hypothetical protein